MSQQEMLQIIDPETGEPTGEHVSRKEHHERRLWARTTNVFVLNSKGEILCHQRSLDKERYPGAWFTHFGGHIVEGESFKIGAMKELEEEAGIKVNAFQMIPWRTSRKSISRSWMRDYLTMWDGDAKSLPFQQEEIQQLQWCSAREILEHLGTQLEDQEGGEWIAGTHDFNADYQCMRAVLTAAIDIGIFGGDYKHMNKWHPPAMELLG